MKLLNVIGIGELIDTVGKTIDNIINNKNEREQLRLELYKIFYQLDMSSDSWLSKNIRPLVLLIGWFVFVLFSCLDGSVISIKEIYIELLGKMLWTITGFYFGLREVGKVLLSRKDRKN